MSQMKNHELRAYVKAEDYRRLKKESVSRNLSLSKTVRDCLLEYLNLREELATALNEPGSPGDELPGKIIHTLLAQTEERIAATIERLEERLSNQQEQLYILTAMLDRFYMGVMQHLPEVPEEIAEGAVASASRRHVKWLSAVEKLLVAEGS